MVEPLPEGVIWKPARQFVAYIAPGYNPPSTPWDVAAKVTAPCCNSSAPPSSICSMKLTVVWPSRPVPPAICKVCPTTDTADDGSLTTHIVGSNPGPRYSSSMIAGFD